MTPTREQLVLDLKVAKQQSVKRWTEIVETGCSCEHCGYCCFETSYNNVLEGIEGHACGMCPVDPLDTESGCFRAYDVWCEDSSKENAQAVLDVVSSVDVEDFVDKLLRAQEVK